MSGGEPLGPPPGHDALGYAPPVLESISTGGTEPSMPPPPEMSTEPSMPPPSMGMMEPQMPPPPLAGGYIAEGGLFVNADIKIQLCGKRMGMDALKKIAFGGCAAAATSTRYRGDEHANPVPPSPLPASWPSRRQGPQPAARLIPDGFAPLKMACLDAQMLAHWSPSCGHRQHGGCVVALSSEADEYRVAVPAPPCHPRLTLWRHGAGGDDVAEDGGSANSPVRAPGPRPPPAPAPPPPTGGTDCVNLPAVANGRWSDFVLYDKTLMCDAGFEGQSSTPFPYALHCSTVGVFTGATDAACVPVGTGSCRDVAGWHDTSGDTCAHYAVNGWCCPEAEPGCNSQFKSPGPDGVTYDSDSACCNSCHAQRGIHGATGPRHPPLPVPLAPVHAAVLLAHK
jgi:hypothetical protein